MYLLWPSSPMSDCCRLGHRPPPALSWRPAQTVNLSPTPKVAQRSNGSRVQELDQKLLCCNLCSPSTGLGPIRLSICLHEGEHTRSQRLRTAACCGEDGLSRDRECLALDVVMARSRRFTSDPTFISHLLQPALLLLVSIVVRSAAKPPDGQPVDVTEVAPPSSAACAYALALLAATCNNGS